MDKSKLEKSAKLFSVGLVLLFLYSMAFALFPDTMAQYTLQHFVKGNPVAANPVYMNLLVNHVRIIGFMGAGLILLTSYAVWTGLRKGEKLSLFAIVIGGGLGIGILITEHMILRTWPLFIAENIGLAPIGSALGIAVSEILLKKDNKES